MLQDVDFVALTETHMYDEISDNLNMPGFECIAFKNRKQNSKSRTAAGGIAIFAKVIIVNLFQVVKCDNQDAIWVKMKKEITGEEKDIFIGTYYISPSKSNENSEKIAKLNEDVMQFQKKGEVILNGDFNARTSNLEDFILPEKHEKDRKRRNSQDKDFDERGKEISELCKNFELNILNGRKIGDLFGEYTSLQWNGKCR